MVDVSTRHLSYVETGRSRPSAGLIERITEHLDVPLRERNAALLAGGFAPSHPQHRLNDPALRRVSDALRSVLDAHRPFPAVLLDRWWDIVDANDAVAALTAGCAPQLLEPPVNVLRLTLHPDGLWPRLLDPAPWRAHLLSQLEHRLDRTGDERLRDLRAEIGHYPGPVNPQPAPRHQVVVPLRLRLGERELALFSLTSRVSTAWDVAVEDLTVETFHPADDSTARAFRAGIA